MDINCSCVYFRKAECTHYKRPENECWFLINGKCKPKQKTNADRIRAMSDEEFVDFLGHNSLCDRIQDDDGAWCRKQAVCKDCLLEWLKQPAEEGADNG